MGQLRVTVLIKNHKKKTNDVILNTYIGIRNCCNEWLPLGFVIPTLPWGGYPGNKDNDIQSGQGYVHNSLLFESPQKGVV